MNDIFRMQDAADDVAENEGFDADDDAQPRERAAGRLEQALSEVVGRPDVLARVRALAAETDRPDPSAYGSWLRRTTHETLAEAALQACIAVAPRHATTDALVADIEERDGHARVWITETTLGGAGVIQAIAETFAAEPRALFRAIEAALAPTDLEIASYGLEQFVDIVGTDPEIASAVADLRAAASHAERDERRARLYAQLSEKSLDVGHALSVALNARLLRQGAGPELDRLLQHILERWRGLEAELGVAVGLREICYVVALETNVAEQLRAIVGLNQPPSATETVQILTGLLWPRGVEIRQRALQSYNPYRQPRLTDPLLARTLLLELRLRRISVTEPECMRALTEALAHDGSAELAAIRTDALLLRRLLVEATITPVDVGYLQFYPTVERIERGVDGLVATLVLREQT
jgi:hypothetical protein